MKAILVDDEMNNLTTLAWELQENCPDISVVASCTSAEEARVAIEQHQPDVVFLDIQMPHENGFDLLRSLPDISFEVIFITAFDQYAIEAFRVNAVDYLLKPIDREDLVQAVQKMKIRKQTGDETQQLLEQMLQTITQESGKARVALPTHDGLEFVYVSDILYAEASSNYTVVYYKDKRSIISKTLKDIQVMMQPFGFIRVHNSYLINPAHISKYIKHDGGYLLMADGKQLSVSRGRKLEVLQLFSKL